MRLTALGGFGEGDEETRPLRNGKVRLVPTLRGGRLETRVKPCAGRLPYFALFSDDKAQLHEWKEAVQQHLNGLRLQLNWRRSAVYPTRTGIPFLGFRIFPTHRRLRADNVRLARRRLQANRDAYLAGRMSLAKFKESLLAWIAHADHGDTYRLRLSLLREIVL